MNTQWLTVSGVGAGTGIGAPGSLDDPQRSHPHGRPGLAPDISMDGDEDEDEFFDDDDYEDEDFEDDEDSLEDDDAAVEEGEDLDEEEDDEEEDF